MGYRQNPDILTRCGDAKRSQFYRGKRTAFSLLHVEQTSQTGRAIIGSNTQANTISKAR